MDNAAKVTIKAPMCINEVLSYQFAHRKISTLTFGKEWYLCVLCGSENKQ